MTKRMRFLFLLSLAGIVLFTSCRKEYSCEECGSNPTNGNVNKPPVANAGADQVITLPLDSIRLDGILSMDPDGTITSFSWIKISGPSSFTISNASLATTGVKNLVTGVYQFELIVTDNGGLSARDTVDILVNDPSVNHPPVAHAGPDQTIILPVNVVDLDGSGSTDPDFNISTYLWTKLSGPSSYTIINASAVQTPVTALVQGVYLFELMVKDAGGLFTKDTVQVSVISMPPACPDCRIVFVSNRDGNDEIYSCNFDGSIIRRLTYNAGTDDQPAWSPDGTKIAFISDRTGDPELYIMNADGSNVVRKTFSNSYSQNPTWSPDGTKIAYSTLSNGSSNIWVIGAGSGLPSLLFGAPGYDDAPSWSPDGTMIALVSDWMAYDFVYDIYTINADGTGFTSLTASFIDNLDFLNPSWSPNGSKLAMAVTQQLSSGLYSTQVGIMKPDGSDKIVIRYGAATGTKTSWSGDGTKIVYTSLFGSRKDVSWVSADGSAWGTIVANGWNADWQN